MRKVKQESKPYFMGVRVILAVVFLAMGAVLLMKIMKEYGYVASGNDAWGHLFKSDLMYQNIKEGNLYPLYTNLWYNGIQPYRYWAPFPYYLMATLQWVAQGSILNAYYIFAGVSFFFGGMGWILWGNSTKRLGLCTLIGALWFFFPENLRVFFCEGNIPRMVTAILIPYFVYFVWLFIRKEKKAAVIPIMISTALIGMTHLMISAMLGVATFVFLLFHVLGTKKIKKSVQALISILIGYSLMGIWLVPSLSGGLVGMDADASTIVMESLSYELLSSINPFSRIHGIADTFYYGVGIIIISIVGIVLSNRDRRSGYYTNIVVLLSTTTAAVPFLSKLPLSQLFWMMRFATIAYAFFLWSFIEWKNARRYFIILLMSVLIIDCLPSLELSKYYTQGAGGIKDELQIVEKITKQRVSILDLSAYGSYPSYELCEGDKPIQYSFGWAWQGAATASNIVQLNSALEEGDYEYLFDRCVELGDDTVVIRKELIEKAKKTKEFLQKAASKSGYFMYQETNQTYILHRETPVCFGIQTEYTGLGIGKYVNSIVQIYPSFIVGRSDNIEDYSIGELLKYNTIFLSGFEYYSLKNAEDIINKLAEQGVKIVIDMTHIPVDRSSNRMHFLGVNAQDITFQLVYPTLFYQGKEINGFDFPKEYYNWNTKYIEGVTNILGSANYSGQKMVFAGTKEEKDIIFMGFNLMFYGIQTRDPEILAMMSEILETELYTLPERRMIPIEVQYYDNKIIIDTPVTPINTTIAYQDIFDSENKIENQGNLLIVNQKHTEIDLNYPHLEVGILITGIGFFVAFIWTLIIKQEK